MTLDKIEWLIEDMWLTMITLLRIHSRPKILGLGLRCCYRCSFIFMTMFFTYGIGLDLSSFLVKHRASCAVVKVSQILVY